MTIPHHELDVRPILRDGGAPFSIIMEAVAALAPGQSLRLLASFKPVPLFQVLGARGFEAAAREIGGGDWEVVFTPAAVTAPVADTRPLRTMAIWTTCTTATYTTSALTARWRNTRCQ